MRSDDDKRTDKMTEIDDFLSQFESPSDNFTTDIDSYLDATSDTRYTAAKTFHGRSNDQTMSKIQEGAKDSAAGKAEKVASTKDKSDKKAEKSSRLGRKGKKDKKSKSKSNKKFKYSNISLDLKGLTLKEKIKAIFMFLFFDTNPYYNPSEGEYVIVNGKKVKNKPLRFSLRKFILNIVILGLTFILAFIIYALVVITTAPKINADDIYASVAESSQIYDSDGNMVDTVYYTEDRDVVSYEDLPEDLVNAFVAIEDKTFWKHHGFNWTRMAGAVVSSITGGGSISGTSTITQQLARNVYLEDIKSVRSIKRKIIEMYYAGQIERCMSKEEIIEAYLNTIYLGYGAYGVQSASNAYFSKDVKDLTVVECAALASLPPAPDSYALVQVADSSTVTDDANNIITRDPVTLVANDITKDRRDTTLSLMYDQGYITKEQYEEAKGKDLISFINPTYSTGNSDYTYFNDYLVSEVIDDLVKKYDMTEEDAEKMVYSKGLKIYSTLDSQAQSIVNKEFNDSDNFPNVTGYSTDGNDNIVSDGAIKMYSYGTYFDSSGNFALGSDECTVNDDGSITLLKDKRLNLYKTEYSGTVDYSIEFKSLYTKEDGTLYNIPGGYINVPAEYKTADKDGNVTISADYFKDHEGMITISDGTVVITPNVYTLQQKVVQPQSAMVITEVGTGQIKAMVGGRSVTGRKLFNRCTTTRQPGSSIKPLTVYGSALQKSFELEEAGKTWDFTDFGYDSQGTQGWGSYITAASTVIDEKMTVNGKVWPQNSGGGYSGRQTFRTALQQSLNTCAVKILLQVTPDYAFSMLEKFGITTGVSTSDDSSVNDVNAASMALGGLTKGVQPLEMALAYAAFPNGGVRNTAIAYTKVVDRNGKTILTAKSKEHKVLDAGVAWIMADCLKSNVTQGIAGSAYLNNVQSGGKTGTTDDQYDIWFDGFTPTYSASLWIGVDCNLALTSMSGPAASLWGRIMRQIDKADTGTYKEMPSNVLYSNGEYYTTGTNVGSTKYQTDAEKKAEEEAAAQKAAEEEAAKKAAEEAAKKKAEEEAAKKEEEAADPVAPVNP